MNNSYVTNVIMYLRKSREDLDRERETGEDTLQAHRERLTALCNQLGIAFVERAEVVSGDTIASRPVFTRVLEQDIPSGKYQAIVVTEMSRLGRGDMEDAGRIYKTLIQHSLLVITPHKTYDPTNPADLRQIRFELFLSREEFELIRDRLNAGKERAAQKGKWLGGRVMYGYELNRQFFPVVKDERIPGFELSEADVVRLIFERVAYQGATTYSLADYLNVLGVPPPYLRENRARTLKKNGQDAPVNGLWHPSSVNKILKNPAYKGVHYYGIHTKRNRKPIERQVPAIVSEELWEAAQRALRRNFLEAARNGKALYPLRGLIKCSCGSSYAGYTSGRPSDKQRYYRCMGKWRWKYRRTKCSSKNLNADWIEGMVWNDILAFVRNPDAVLVELMRAEELAQNVREQLENDLVLLEGQASGKEKEKDLILDLYRRGLIQVGDVEKQLAKIEEEKKALLAEVNRLKLRLASEAEKRQKAESARAVLQSLRAAADAADIQTKAAVIKALVKEVRVETDDQGKVKVVATYEFGDRPAGGTINHMCRGWDCNLSLALRRKYRLP